MPRFLLLRSACTLAGKPIFRVFFFYPKQVSTDVGSVSSWGVESIIAFWVDILDGVQIIGLRGSVD
eukprot:scaffold258174_cov23-Tisochrysis_lutea.AAC.1